MKNLKEIQHVLNLPDVLEKTANSVDYNNSEAALIR